MFDPDYDKQERVGEEGGNPFEDKEAAAAAMGAKSGSDAYSSAAHGADETKKKK